MTRTDDELRALIRDAVADVHPSDRIGEIRARVAGPERRPWLVGGAAVLASAAAVAAIVMGIAQVGDGDRSRPEPAPDPTPSPSCSATGPGFLCIAAPTEGAEVTGILVARGWANSPEANVPWHVLNAGGERVLEGFTTATGWGDRLYPWTSEIDVSELDPGRYTFVASTDDPSGGAEGPGPHTDTRTFVVE